MLLKVMKTPVTGSPEHQYEVAYVKIAVGESRIKNAKRSEFFIDCLAFLFTWIANQWQTGLPVDVRIRLFAFLPGKRQNRKPQPRSR